MTEAEKSLERLRRIDLSKIGKFPLLLEPSQKMDVYQSGSDNFPYDYCGSTTNPPPVFKWENIVIDDCPKAQPIKEALNALWMWQEDDREERRKQGLHV